MSRQSERYAERFAQAMLEAIRKGTAPWQKPWKRGDSPYPRNFRTGRHYNGSNLLLLMVTALNRGYQDPRWGGFGQIRKAGGHVRKGQCGTPVLIVRNVGARKAKAAEEDEESRSRTYVTMQHVFNVEQAEGLELPPQTQTADPSWDPIQAVEDVASDTGVRITEQSGGRASYHPASDTVHMPARSQFAGGDGYYHTLLHELGHATAHPSRLNRPEFTTEPKFRSVEYALEELRAEMSAMMTGARLRIGHSPRHGEAYVAHWTETAGKDPDTIRAAARDAQRISDWLLRNRTEGATEPAGLPHAA